jgi:hypothetical protein
MYHACATHDEEGSNIITYLGKWAKKEVRACPLQSECQADSRQKGCLFGWDDHINCSVMVPRRRQCSRCKHAQVWRQSGINREPRYGCLGTSVLLPLRICRTRLTRELEALRRPEYLCRFANIRDSKGPCRSL